MTFSYTARTSNGSLKRGTLVAGSRTDALARIKAQGDVPITVTEINARSTPLGRVHSLLTMRSLCMAGVAVAVIGLGVWLLIPSSPKDRDILSLDLAPTPLRKPIDTPPVDQSLEPTDNLTVSTNVVENMSHSSAAAATTGSRPVARTPSVVDDESNKATEEPRRPRPYRSLTEQLIAMLGRPGEAMPPLPIADGMIGQEDFERALNNVIEIYEDDDDRTAQQKEIVAWIKMHMKEVVNEEWTPAQYLRELEAFRKEQALERRVAYEVLKEIEELSPEDAELARKELNAELEERGILKLDE